MRKKYDIFIISRVYLRGYYNYLIKNTDINSTKEAYSLFMYSMKKLFNLETFEYSTYICKYGDDCVDFLDKLPGTPTNKNNISYEDRVRVISICEGYAKAVGILTREVINNSRLNV